MSWEGIASIATAIGVAIAAWQIWESRKIASAAYEDAYDQQYRQLIYQIPVDVLLDKPLISEHKKRAREAIYNYLDLCNEQVYQRSKKKISTARWNEWRKGIETNLKVQAIAEVWEEVHAHNPNNFSFLSKLVESSYKIDPSTW